jgi:hypothetical protein
LSGLVRRGIRELGILGAQVVEAPLSRDSRAS